MPTSPVPGVIMDASIALGLFLHWLVVGIVVDQTGNSVDARKWASLWLFIATVGTNVFTIGRSYIYLSSGGDPSKRPETMFGLFCEIVSLAQAWGLSFCFVRVWELEADHPFQTKPFLHNVGNSVFEMSLVQAGVGWAAEAPVTVGERAVAWCAAYIGGVLAVNLFFISVLLGRRAWWASAPVQQSATYQSFDAAPHEAGMNRVSEWQLASLGR